MASRIERRLFARYDMRLQQLEPAARELASELALLAGSDAATAEVRAAARVAFAMFTGAMDEAVRLRSTLEQEAG